MTSPPDPADAPSTVAADDDHPASPEGVDLDRLRPWFAEHVEGATGAPLRASLISGGRSNLTYLVGDGSTDWVLRRPPLGHVLPTAHDMARECRVLRALAPTDVPVPAVLASCEDEAVNDAPFYVMEKVDGLVARTPDDLAGIDPATARRCSEALVDVLVALHRVDYEAVGLGDFGRPDGYLERQVRRWGQQWERSSTRELPEIDELVERLRRSLPESGPPTIVHGDYRLDNTMLAPDDHGRIVAVLDWEMATIGDPLADVGLFLLYSGRPEAQLVAASATSDTARGFLDRDAVIARYAASSGRDLAALDWYEVFAFYKLAVILEGIHARFLMGKTLGAGFEHIGTLVEHLVRSALAVASSSTLPGLRA